MYLVGEGVTKDLQESLKWSQKAAAQGHTLAIKFVGHAYETGLGTATNREEAIKWYRIAASKGEPVSQAALKRLQEQPVTTQPK